MPEGRPSDQKIHASFAGFDASTTEQASHILRAIWQYTRPQYSTPQACLDAISKDVKLHKALQEAHLSQNYDVIWNWPYFLEDSIMQTKVERFLSEIEHAIGQVVKGRITLLPWPPKSASFKDAKIRCHLQRLRILALKDEPNLLLHDLGSFKTDKVLSKRLDDIFMPGSHTFLFNTPGSGKTRLLLEGLCDNWGFYFTSFVNSSLLGSGDVQNSIQTHIPGAPNFRGTLPPAGAPNYNAALRSNRDIASNVFRRIFLARLLIFSRFTQIMETESHRTSPTPVNVYRQRWLLLQLQPSLIPTVRDIFDHLSGVLSPASDSYINTQTELLLQGVRELCTCKSSTSPKQTPFFCVLDEAQYAASQHTTSFRSDHNSSHQPILREIVRAWEGQSSGWGVFIVVAGTGISKDVVDQAMASAIMKDSKYRCYSDTGAFDKARIQQRYLEKYLPNNLLNSESGKRLMDRIWYWLHGRHRFTAGYVVELIRNGYNQPHKLLNAYVKHFTGFSITDAHDYIEDEGQGLLPILSQYKLDFSKLEQNSDMLATIHQVTTRYLIRSIPCTLGKDEAMYVQYGFARFLDPRRWVAAINEPLVLLAAIRWMNSNHQSSYKILAREIDTHRSTHNGFENYVVYCIDLILSQKRKYRLNEVFTFCGTPPTWADMEAELVALHYSVSGDIETAVASFQKSVGPSVTLGINAKSPESTLSWLNHRLHSPFCFPNRAMGPDAMFVLKLSDGTLIWVALQAKWSQEETLTKELVLKAMKSVTPAKYFLNKGGQPHSPVSRPALRDNVSRALLDLPHRRNDAGRYSLLRVIASFPAQYRLESYIKWDPDEEEHPIAALNMARIKELTEKLPPEEFLRSLETHTRSQKRKAAGKESRRPKRLKL